MSSADISQPAAPFPPRRCHFLQKNGIYAEYGTLADNIINRKGDGICPFEAAVLEINDTDAAYEAIRAKMREMNISI